MARVSPQENYARTRRKLGLSHHEMGRLLGVQHTTSLRWENGDRRPPPYIDALMVALYRGAMNVEVLTSWRDAADRTIEG
jgi:DNA-binding transcriptional regulator YiaG